MELSQEEKILSQRKEMERLRHDTYHLRPSSSPASSAWLRRQRSKDKINRKMETAKKKQELRTTQLLKEAKDDRIEESKEQFQLWLQWKKKSKNAPMRFTVFKQMQQINAKEKAIKTKELNSTKSILKSENQTPKVAQEVTFSTDQISSKIFTKNV